MSCINCCRAWTSEDADADADEIRRESITPHLKKKQDKEGVTSTTVLSDAALVKSVEKDKIEIIIEEEGHKEKATEQQAGQQEENQATKMSTEKGGEEVDAGDYGAAVGAAVGVVQGEAPAVIEADDEEEPEKEHEGDGGKKPATATTAKGVAAEEESEKASEVSEAFEELPKAEVIPKSPSTTGEGGTEAEEGTAVSTSASSGSVIESDDTASAPVAPGFGDSTGGALALPEAEVVKEVDTSEEDAEAAKAAQAVKRVEENLTKGGLLGHDSP